ncbi:MAG: hypothetical protein ACRC2T_17060 [Thermoguttaceae bacterium]
MKIHEIPVYRADQKGGETLRVKLLMPERQVPAHTVLRCKTKNAFAL